MMAEVVLPHDHRGHVGSIGGGPLSGGPRIEIIRNPDFSFPRHTPQAPDSPFSRDRSGRRPASMHGPPSVPSSALKSHRRAISTLPSFSFNAEDTSGRQEADVSTPMQTPDAGMPIEAIPVTPSRRGHRRGGSELVGGDPRFGVSNVVSSSPTKANAFPLSNPVPVPQPSHRGHAHRRSAAISGHDLSSIIHSNEAQARLSTSLPNTPMEFPDQVASLTRVDSAPIVPHDLADPFGLPLEVEVSRPPSRPRVEFSDNVEYIPRPLSTISSGTESSLSTIRGHSVNNSISSVLSLSTPSPPSARVTLVTRGTCVEERANPRTKSSLEISKRVEREGEWLKSRSSQSLSRPSFELMVTAPTAALVERDLSFPRHGSHYKKRSISHVLGLDRRRSEPSLGVNADNPSRFSALSLQDSSVNSETPVGQSNSAISEHILSTRRLKIWAVSKIGKRPRESPPPLPLSQSSSHSSMRLDDVSEALVPGKVDYVELPIAETDLDTVFGNEDVQETPSRPSTPLQAALELSNHSPGPCNDTRVHDSGDESPVLDLDAALGPFKTPLIGSQRQRRELHSSRPTRDLNGARAAYHRRSESAPALAPFHAVRVSTPPAAMADVFEEEEEEAEEDITPGETSRPESKHPIVDDELGIGIQIVDSDIDPHSSLSQYTPNDGLGIRDEWAPDRPIAMGISGMSRLATPSNERRPSSVIEDTIIEEPTLEDGIEIVEAHEEPRAPSLTKSSDSSETPTLLGPPGGMLTLPDGSQRSMTPDTYQTSTFSSPDFARRQSSFDTSRLGTSASSVTDNRTMSSCTTGENAHELRMSVDDVPSLTSSRSTMLSMSHANSSRHDVSAGDRTPSASTGTLGPTVVAERRHKRGSIQSLSQLVGGSFGSRSKGNSEAARPQTSVTAATLLDPAPPPKGQQRPSKPPKKEHRLKKLMFWKTKQLAKHQRS